MSVPAKDLIPPIQILPPTVVSSAPNTLDDLTYILGNDSDKPVVALGVNRTISYEENGKVYAHSAYRCNLRLRPIFAVGVTYLSA